MTGFPPDTVPKTPTVITVSNKALFVGRVSTMWVVRETVTLSQGLKEAEVLASSVQHGNGSQAKGFTTWKAQHERTAGERCSTAKCVIRTCCRLGSRTILEASAAQLLPVPQLHV